MISNYQRVAKGFETLTEGLASYVGAELRVRFGDEWWGEGVLGALHDNQKQELPASGEDDDLISKLDAARCLRLMDVHWNDHFRDKLDHEHRVWINELIEVHKKLAHKKRGDMANIEARRPLDTMTRLAEQIAPEATEPLRELSLSVGYQTRRSAEAAPGRSASRSAMTSSAPAQDDELTVEQILDCLEKHRTRATYSAVGEVIRRPQQIVGTILGDRRPRASWVVRVTDGEPTGYSPDKKHPDLYHNPHIIKTGEELRELCVRSQYKDRKAEH